MQLVVALWFTVIAVLSVHLDIKLGRGLGRGLARNVFHTGPTGRDGSVELRMDG